MPEPSGMPVYLTCVNADMNFLYKVRSRMKARFPIGLQSEKNNTRTHKINKGKFGSISGLYPKRNHRCSSIACRLSNPAAAPPWLPPCTFYIRHQGGRPEYSKSDQIKYVLTSDAASTGSTAALLSAAARGEIRKKIGDMGCVAAMERETRDK
jgi:hypothetical protein